MEWCNDWPGFTQAVASCFSLSLDKRQVDQLKILYEKLIEANKVMNLTRITEFEDFCVRHLLDSLTLLPLLREQPGVFRVMDVGSGAGFPALPLAVVFPAVHMVAVEAVGKKARFIQQTAQAMGLWNLEVQSQRSEELAHEPGFREQFDVVTARALAPLNVLVELCLPFVRVGGVLLAMKTLDVLSEELDAAMQAIGLLGGQYRHTRDVSLPGLPNRAILLIEKVGATPSKYPRKPGVPAKKPL